LTLRVAIVATLALCLPMSALAGAASGEFGEPPSNVRPAGSGQNEGRALIGFEPVPRSLAVDGAGYVYLSNPQANGQVQRFAPNGTLLNRWGHFGSGRESRDIAANAAGFVYVAERSIGRIRMFTFGGGFVGQWRASAVDVAVDAAGYVYGINRLRLERFSPRGTLVGRWGSSGTGPGQFGDPWGIATGSGNVYVVDTFSNRIEVFTSSGSFVGEWGTPGKGPGQFSFPYGIATGPAGNVYVADTANDRIQKFTPTGALITAWGSPGRRPGQFLLPTSVVTDPLGYVYVVDAAEAAHSAGFDSGIARIQKFTPNGQFVTQWRGARALILGKPKVFSHLRGKTTRRSAVFRFRSRQRGVYFQCRLGGERVPRKLRAWRRCVSPRRYGRLRPGVKSFQVRVFKDLEPGRAATRWWRVVKRRAR
jgi:hypothetical protein